MPGAFGDFLRSNSEIVHGVITAQDSEKNCASTDEYESNFDLILWRTNLKHMPAYSEFMNDNRSQRADGAFIFNGPHDSWTGRTETEGDSGAVVKCYPE
jgi:hypothetical protein